MKQVWRTEDGAIFDDHEIAQQWERSQTAIKELAYFIEGQTCRLDEEDSREIAAAIIAHYNVSKK